MLFCLCLKRNIHTWLFEHFIVFPHHLSEEANKCITCSKKTAVGEEIFIPVKLLMNKKVALVAFKVRHVFCVNVVSAQQEFAVNQLRVTTPQCGVIIYCRCQPPPANSHIS